ncbi:hypothetical protein [Methylobacterium sp. Leaf117]|uniref:hypothetical protein n=1 Tax=Methylobacterium sp. Leaf117 TaxID=1736260 RepID=UPI0006F74012|nr:hypothetical protein [Methylobacterium sp. Leaf117]KQP82839.1 hypothetical protein ASF57_11935 [Methylobacterium sp. Leaf117]
MTERDAGYLYALADVQSEVRKMVLDPSTSKDGKLELLGVLSLLSMLVDAKMQREDGREVRETSDEIAAGRDE